MDSHIIFLFLYFSVTICESKKWCSCVIRISHVRVDFCTRERAVYNCDEGYERSRFGVLECSRSGNWIPTPSCKPKPCLDTIPNGAVSSTCTAEVGSTCEYTCDAGYHAVQTPIVCEASTHWSGNLHALCFNETQCPYQIQHGFLDLSCRRRPGDTCSFTCSERYMSSYKEQTVYCNTSQTWDPPLLTACKEIVCPVTIPNGHIHWSCSRGYKDICSRFECDAGYQLIYRPHSLRCNSGEWVPSEYLRQLCIKERPLCPEIIIENGKLSPTCDRRPNSVCLINCNSGCYTSYTDQDQDSIYCSRFGSNSSNWSLGPLRTGTPSCKCSDTPYHIALVAMVGGVVLLIGCIVGGAVRQKRQRRSRSKCHTSVSHQNRTSTRPAAAARTESPENRAATSTQQNTPQPTQRQTTQQNTPQHTQCQTTTTTQTRYCGRSVTTITSLIPDSELRQSVSNVNVTTAVLNNGTTATENILLQREHNNEQITNLQFQPTIHSTECIMIQAPPAYSTLAERPPSYSETAHQPPCYNATGEPPPSYRTIEQEPPGCSAVAERPIYTTETEAPPRYSAIAEPPPPISTLTRSPDNNPIGQGSSSYNSRVRSTDLPGYGQTMSNPTEFGVYVEVYDHERVRSSN